MANLEHVRIVKNGSDAINKWIEDHLDEILDLSYANLIRANLTGAQLIRANLTGVDLSNAKLTGADLTGADLTGARLTGADLKNSISGYTIFAHCDLSKCKDLSTVKHRGPSSIGVDTLIITYREANGLSKELEQFFINAGVPKELLDALPSIIRDIKYKSCFISYGEPDKDFAMKLYDELKRRGVPCWIYSMDSTPGKRTWKEITEKRREADQMIVVCSAKSLIRNGVKKEIEEQIDDDPDKIIPISLDKDWINEEFEIKRGSRDLKPFLLDKNYLDFIDRKIDDDKIEKLLKALEFRHPSP